MLYEVMSKARCVRTVAVFVLLGALAAPLAAEADPPTPLNVLFVANGYYTQETDIENHFLDLGYTVTRMKDYKVKGTTNLTPYNLIVITEFAPSIPTSGLNNIKASGKPVLIVEYWDFWYSYKFGLVTTSNCGYVGTDTVTAISDGYDDFTSRVGSEALVYQPSYTVYGIDLAHVKSNATPLYWSSESFGEVAMLVDYTKKYAATGVYDTRKYTVDAWKMFDILLSQILPETGRYSSVAEIANAYYESGLYSFAAEVEAEPKRDPHSWTFEEAEKEAWLLTTEWRLEELWQKTVKALGEVFQVAPGLLWPTYSHPQDRTDFSDEYWFLGQDYEQSGGDYVVPRFTAYHGGTDLGMSVELDGRAIFYMGDTWDGTASSPSYSTTDCPSPAVCNDMIAVSFDGNAANGVDVTIVKPSGESGKYYPISIPGVHRDLASELSGYWGGGNTNMTVPSGVVVAHPTYFTMSLPPISFQLETVVLWYSTASAPNFITNDANQRPTSWTGCSLDGIHFYKCYQNTPPFSIDEPTLNSSTDAPARFIQVAAIDVTRDDLASVCTGGSEDTALCDLYDATADEAEEGGLLLYGAGRLYRKSGLFLAYVNNLEFGNVDEITGKPLAWYWTGSGWSRDEQDATPLVTAGDFDLCQHGLSQIGCVFSSDSDRGNVFGEISAKLIHSITEESVVVLLSNHLLTDVSEGNVRYRTARLSTPWLVSDAQVPTSWTRGYGPYIIDRFTEHDGDVGDIGLWHTISVWADGPYGVYTGYQEIAWP